MTPRVERGVTYFTQEEAAERLGISQPAVSKAVAAGRLKATEKGIAAAEVLRYQIGRLSSGAVVVDPDVRGLLAWLLGTEDFEGIPGGLKRRASDPVAFAVAAWIQRETGALFDFEPGKGGALKGNAGRFHLAPWLVLAREAALGLKAEEVTAERVGQLLLLYWEAFGLGKTSDGVRVKVRTK